MENILKNIKAEKCPTCGAGIMKDTVCVWNFGRQEYRAFTCGASVGSGINGKCRNSKKAKLLAKQVAKFGEQISKLVNRCKAIDDEQGRYEMRKFLEKEQKYLNDYED
jgi:hypothetical protein